MGFSTIGGAGGGSAETPSGGAGSAEHAGVEDNSSSNADQIQINDTSVVINKDKDTDMDFRVAGDSGTNLLFCDSSADKIGIGTAAPVNTLHLHETGSGGPCVRLSNDTTGATVNDGFGFGMNSNESVYVWHRENNYIQWATNNTERMRLLAGGNFGIGTTSPDSLLEVSKASADAEVLVSCYHNTEATTPKITFRKADNTEASPALVDDNAVLGTIDFLGHDGVNFERGAKIEARVQGTSASNDLPTELTFWTTPDGSNTAAERVSIGADGAVALKALAAAPSATAAYAKIYTEEYGNDSNVKLLLHMDGSNDGTTFTDSSASSHTVTPTGAVTKTAVKKFGSASAYFDGSDVLTIADSADFTFGADPFTIEFWAYPTSIATTWQMLAFMSGSNEAIAIGYESASGQDYGFFIDINNGGSYNATPGSKTGKAGIYDDTWYHVAFVREATELRCYLNGVLKNTYDIGTTAINDPTGDFTIGGPATSGFTNDYRGYFDEFTITKEARYTADFTPARSAYPVSNLVIVDDNGGEYKLGRNW